ncbi:hypothetical protein [Catenuloplanes atrovinosus]|uniref:Uncharacterized protein n=1 Tax=Catenuloplanes atrovinosus TaxID=137266 RepID=A0AAE3YJW9_9ACTN|nr:hypothetical protein [Catenuloplanes atrovinosus]MDR7275119.1 hypothetical protein [Catenuloplanes atrovinosus]
MRRTLMSTIVLATAAALLPAAPAAARAAAPSLDARPPAAVGSGQNSIEFPVTLTGTGGQDRAYLRLTITPVPGGDVRPLARTLLLTYDGASRRPLTYTTQGDTLIATTPSLTGVAEGDTVTFQLGIALQPTTTAPHVDAMRVDIRTEALDAQGGVLAADPAPDRVTLFEPRAELIGLPAQVRVGTPFEVTVRTTNTTPLAYNLLLETIYLGRTGDSNRLVTVERRDGARWTTVPGPTDNYFWYVAGNYPSLQPGGVFEARLRMTFTDDAAAGEEPWLYHNVYTIFGTPIATDSRPFTILPRA